jgi:hypothetical protein
VALSPKVPKGRTHNRKNRPTKSKAGTRAARGRKLDAQPQETLKARARDLEEKLAGRERELTEALKQQAATYEVLQVISSSPGDLESVFKAMLKNATRICEAKFGVLFRFEGGLFHPAALNDVPPAFADFLVRQGGFAPEPGRLFGRLSQTKKVIHVHDRATESDPSPSVRYGGARSSIAVPMLKKNELIGAFDLEFALAGFAADEGEAQEVEGLRFAEPAPLAAFRRKSSELDEPGLLGMQCQHKLS